MLNRVHQDDYTGNQQFKGLGSQRYCMLCAKHRPTGPGWTMRHMFGGRHWACGEHVKVVAK